MLSSKGIAKPQEVVPSDARPPPSGFVVRAVHNGRANIGVHFSCSGDVPITCSGDVPAVFQRPLEHR